MGLIEFGRQLLPKSLSLPPSRTGFGQSASLTIQVPQETVVGAQRVAITGVFGVCRCQLRPDGDGLLEGLLCLLGLGAFGQHMAQVPVAVGLVFLDYG